MCDGLALVLAGCIAQAAPQPDAAPTEGVAQQGLTAALTEGEVLDSLRGAHPKLEASRRKAERASAQRFGARGAWDPVVGAATKWVPSGYYRTAQADAYVKQATPLWGAQVMAGWRYGRGVFGDDFAVYDGKLRTRTGGELRAGVAIPVWKGGPIDENRAKIRKTEAMEKAARADVDATQLELEAKAVTHYWAWVDAGLQLEIQRELLEIAETRGQGLQRRIAAGSVPEIVGVDNDRTVFDRRDRVVKAERKLQEAALKLSLYLRDEGGDQVVPAEDRLPRDPGRVSPGEPGPLETDIDRAVAQRPEVAALQRIRDAKEVEVRLRKNQRAPDAQVQAGVARDLGGGDASLGETEVGVGLTISIPIPLRAARGALRAAKADLDATSQEIRWAQDQIRTEIRDAHSEVVALARRHSLVEEQRVAADKLADAERRRFELGTADLLRVNLREIAAAEAALKVVSVATAYQGARARYEVLTLRL